MIHKALFQYIDRSVNSSVCLMMFLVVNAGSERRHRVERHPQEEGHPSSQRSPGGGGRGGASSDAVRGSVTDRDGNDLDSTLKT